MGDIGSKLFFAFKGSFQFIHHMVKGVSQPVRFILAAFQMNAPGEIFAKADFFGRFGNGPERSQGLSYEKIAAHGDT